MLVYLFLTIRIFNPRLLTLKINNFGFASLSIHPTYPEDEGVYNCILRNSLGETSHRWDKNDDIS